MSNKLTKIRMYKRIGQKVHNNVQAGFIPQALLNGIYITSGSALYHIIYIKMINT